MDETLAKPFFVGASGFGKADHGVDAVALHDALATGVKLESLVAEPVEGGLSGIVAELE